MLTTDFACPTFGNFTHQVATFITDNTETPQLGGALSGNVDPHTGGSAYVAGSSSTYAPAGKRGNSVEYDNSVHPLSRSLRHCNVVLLTPFF